MDMPSHLDFALAEGGHEHDEGHQSWRDAQCCMALLALDPSAFGGLSIRAHAGPVRDRLVSLLRDLVPEGVPVRRMPCHIADERLLGGLDIAATLSAGRPIIQRGLLSEADGGLVIIPMSERMDPLTVSRLTAVLDRGEISLQRDGLSQKLTAKVACVALDEGLETETISAALADRLAFRVDLSQLSIRDCSPTIFEAPDVVAARAVFAEAAQPSDKLIETVTALATAFGVSSVRAVLFAIRAAQGLAALDTRLNVDDSDIEIAARLVIAPRATRLPVQEEEPDQQLPPEERQDEMLEQEPEPPEASEPDDNDDEQSPPEGPLDDQILEAVEAAIPAHLLEQLKAAAAVAKARSQSSGGKGVQQQALMRGRPIGSRRGRLDGRSKLHVVDTLRTAAPWQPLRRSATDRPGRIHVSGEDIRVRRFKQNEESVTIFLVDASGSAALHRLAEVKGAVELLLAESYARRDYVALITFRGQTADLVLPPTRSLVRAKRSLAGMPGGGGTPLAAGLDAGLDVALECRRQGKTPRLVVLSDAHANVGYSAEAGRSGAHQDAVDAAKRIAAQQIASLFIDTSPQRGGRKRHALETSKALEIAQAMHGVHLSLPQPNAAGLKELIQGDLDQRRAS